MAMKRMRRPIKNKPLAALFFDFSGKVCLCTHPKLLQDVSCHEDQGNSLNGRPDGSPFSHPPAAGPREPDSFNGCFSWGSGPASTSGSPPPYSCRGPKTLPCLPDGALSRPKVDGSDRDSDSDIELPVESGREGTDGEDEVTRYFKLLQEHGVAGPSGLDVRISFKWRPVLPSILEVENSSASGCRSGHANQPGGTRLMAVNRSLKLENFEGLYTREVGSAKAVRDGAVKRR